jgi:signal transduction histidine kinase
MLRTVFRNLLNNAIKFSPEGSSVTVKSQSNQERVTIEVTDEGMGIPEEIRERLFQLDQDVSRPGTKEEKGNGLGLVVCREFIDKHGGEIRVDTKRKKGTRIVFTLPHKPFAAE